MINVKQDALKRSAFTIVSDTFEYANKSIKSPFFTKAAIAVKFAWSAKTIYKREMYDAYFRRFEPATNNELIRNILLNAFNKLPHEVMFSYNNLNIVKYNINGINYYRSISNSIDTASHANIFCDKDDKIPTSKRESNALTCLYGLYGNNFIISKGRNYDNYILNKQQSLNNIYKSDNFDIISKYLNDFLNKNISRSIVLYGNPGTGKTTLAQLLTTELKLSTIKIENQILSYDFIKFVNIMKPDAVIMDDIDKGDTNINSQYIACLELLKKKVKVVIMTANDKDYLEKRKYLVRPGRIDKFFEVNILDRKIILDVIGVENEDLYPLIKEFPMAFVVEAKNIMDVYGKTYLVENIAELQDRVCLNKKKSEIIDGLGDCLIAPPTLSATQN